MKDTTVTGHYTLGISRKHTMYSEQYTRRSRAPAEGFTHKKDPKVS